MSDDRPSRLRPFLLGGIVGGVAAIVADRVREQLRAARATPTGLAAFERAPCYQELLEREKDETPTEARGTSRSSGHESDQP